MAKWSFCLYSDILVTAASSTFVSVVHVTCISTHACCSRLVSGFHCLFRQVFSKNLKTDAQKKTYPQRCGWIVKALCWGACQVGREKCFLMWIHRFFRNILSAARLTRASSKAERHGRTRTDPGRTAAFEVHARDNCVLLSAPANEDLPRSWEWQRNKDKFSTITFPHWSCISPVYMRLSSICKDRQLLFKTTLLFKIGYLNKLVVLNVVKWLIKMWSFDVFLFIQDDGEFHNIKCWSCVIRFLTSGCNGK